MSISISSYEAMFLALSTSEIEAINNEIPEVIDENLEQEYEKFLAE
jgi:hypothetical protein